MIQQKHKTRANTNTALFVWWVTQLNIVNGTVLHSFTEYFMSIFNSILYLPCLVIFHTYIGCVFDTYTAKINLANYVIKTFGIYSPLTTPAKKTYSTYKTVLHSTQIPIRVAKLSSLATLNALVCCFFKLNIRYFQNVRLRQHKFY